MTNIENEDKKRVLFIAPQFYNYHEEIKKSFERLGFIVTFIPEMEQSILYRIYNKLSNKNKNRLEKLHLNKISNLTKEHVFDFVYVIRGGYFDSNTINRMRVNLPEAKFIMYQWDSYKQNDYRELISSFDKISTFDIMDSRDLLINYEPLFYTEIYKSKYLKKEKKEYDLVFFGAYHSDRLNIIKYFHSVMKKEGLIFKPHLYIRKLSLIFRLITGEIKIQDLKFFKTFSVKPEEIARVYSKSSAVLDIELSIQSGLSMRTFEVLGSGAKLITTNVNIKQEDFYVPSAISVIDRKNPSVESGFFTNIQKTVIMDNYHIDRWLSRQLSYKEELE